MSRLNTNMIEISSKQLPGLPLSATQVMQVCNDPCAAAIDVERALAVDVAMTARVLSLANSAAYGFKRTLGSVREAIVALGLLRVRALATASSMAPLFQDRGGLEGRRLWQHALGCALWAQRFAGDHGLPRREQIFTAGLMHDVGLLVLNLLYPDLLLQAVSQAEALGTDLHEAEQDVLGTSHAEVGSKVCTKWRVPLEISRAILGHHTVLIPRVLECSVVTLADTLAQHSGWSNFAWEHQPQLSELDPEHYQEFGMTLADLEAFVDRRRDAVASELRAFMNSVV